MASVTRQNIGNLNDKLSVQVEKEDYLPAFEKKLKEYSKTANIPGFRKGMVPAGMIKKMYGAGIFQDEVLRAVEKELYTYLSTEKPAIFGQPLPLVNETRLNMASPDAYVFDFEIGVKPDFKVADVSSHNFTLNKVEITDAMMEEEISRMQIKGGNMTEPENIDNPENVLNVLFTETDEQGNPVEGGIEKENSVLLKYFTKPLQEQLTGKTKGDSVTFQLNKTFEGKELDAVLQDLGFETGDTAAAEKFFKMEIVKIGLIEKRGLDESFFNEVFPGKEIKDEAAFRDALKKDMETYWTAQSQNQLHDQIYHHLIDDTQMEFPEPFLKRWLQTSGEKEKTADEAAAEFPTFKNQLKWTLISDNIITDHKIEVTDEEIRANMREDVMRYFGQMNAGAGDMEWLDSYLDRMMKDEKQLDSSYRKLITEKMFKALADKSKTTEKTVTAEELIGMQHNHTH